MKILITGGTSGIGRSVALLAGRNGHDVDVVGGTNEAKGEKLIEEFAEFQGTLRFYPVDLSSIEEIKTFASEYTSEASGPDVVFLNAGVLFKPPVIDADGYDKSFMVNYTHKFMLALLLFDTVKQSNGRILINGGGNFSFGLKLDQDTFARSYAPMSSAMQSSYAIGFLVHWINKTFSADVPVQGINPGFVKTQTNMGAGFVNRVLVSMFGISPDEAAAHIVDVIENDSLRDKPGAYFDKGKEKPFKRSITGKPDVFETLWQQSLQIAGLEQPDWAK